MKTISSIQKAAMATMGLLLFAANAYGIGAGALGEVKSSSGGGDSSFAARSEGAPYIKKISPSRCGIFRDGRFTGTYVDMELCADREGAKAKVALASFLDESYQNAEITLIPLWDIIFPKGSKRIDFFAKSSQLKPGNSVDTAPDGGCTMILGEGLRKIGKIPMHVELNLEPQGTDGNFLDRDRVWVVHAKEYGKNLGPIATFRCDNDDAEGMTGFKKLLRRHFDISDETGM